jgi:hypothetical protein
MGTCCYNTCQPHGPHRTDVPHVRTSPRCSTLHAFSDEGATPSPPKTLIHNVVKRQISWLSFLLDQRFRSNHDLVTWGFEQQRTPPLYSRYPNSRDDLDLCHLSSKLDSPDAFEDLTSPLPYTVTRIKPRTPFLDPTAHRNLTLLPQSFCHPFYPFVRLLRD